MPVRVAHLVENKTVAVGSERVACSAAAVVAPVLVAATEAKAKRRKHKKMVKRMRRAAHKAGVGTGEHHAIDDQVPCAGTAAAATAELLPATLLQGANLATTGAAWNHPAYHPRWIRPTDRIG